MDGWMDGCIYIYIWVCVCNIHIHIFIVYLVAFYRIFFHLSFDVFLNCNDLLSKICKMFLMTGLPILYYISGYVLVLVLVIK